MSDSLITLEGKKIILNRTYTSVATLNEPVQFKVGIDSSTINVSDTNLTNAVPIDDGTTCDDGSNQLTGSGAGSNSTDNTSVFKEGGGNSDVTAQNLIKDNSAVKAIWTIANLAAAGANAVSTQYVGCWLYIKDATALAKFKTSSTCFEIKIGSAVGDYYSKTYETGDLVVGWNWITSNTDLLSAWTETGTVAGNIDTFILEITTNNATDTFVAGDLVYDLLRQWEASDLVKDFEAVPTIDDTSLTSKYRCVLLTTEANGFLIDSHGTFNDDSSIKLYGEDSMTEESKSSTDQFTYIVVDTLE